MNNIDQLADYIRVRGPILSVRVSSAQASGRGKQYAYFGAVRYQIVLTKRGTVSAIPQGRASSDRRSFRLAGKDADDIAAREGRIRFDGRGPLDEESAEYVLSAAQRR